MDRVKQSFFVHFFKKGALFSGQYARIPGQQVIIADCFHFYNPNEIERSGISESDPSNVFQ